MRQSAGWAPGRRNEQGWLGYHLWAIKPITCLDPDECEHSDDWMWDFDFAPDLGGEMRRRSSAGRLDPLTTGYDPNPTLEVL